MCLVQIKTKFIYCLETIYIMFDNASLLVLWYNAISQPWVQSSHLYFFYLYRGCKRLSFNLDASKTWLPVRRTRRKWEDAGVELTHAPCCTGALLVGLVRLCLFFSCRCSLQMFLKYKIENLHIHLQLPTWFFKSPRATLFMLYLI